MAFAHIDGAPDLVALYESILAALHVEATSAQGLYLAVAHAGEIGADDVAGGLQHALLEEQRLGIEARAPELASVRVD